MEQIPIRQGIPPHPAQRLLEIQKELHDMEGKTATPGRKTFYKELIKESKKIREDNPGLPGIIIPNYDVVIE